MAWHKHIPLAPELPDNLWYKVSYMGMGMYCVSVREKGFFSEKLGEAYGGADFDLVHEIAKVAYESYKYNIDVKKPTRENNREYL